MSKNKQKPNAPTQADPILETSVPLDLSITELDLPDNTIDHLIEQGIQTLGDLIKFSRDQEAMEAVLESESRQQVQTLVVAYSPQPPQPPEPPAATAPPADPQKGKSGTKKNPNPTKSKSGSEIDPSDPDAIKKTDAQLREDFLDEVRKKAASESDDKLARMLARAKLENDNDIAKIMNAEIDKRFEATREKQQSCTIEIKYSSLKLTGYSTSEKYMSDFKHLGNQRISHEGAVALKKIFLAMKESGEKLRNGRRVTKKTHVIHRLLEKAYEGMRRQ